MKKLLAILMVVAGFSAYAAGLLKVTQLGTKYLAAECFPSGHSCNGLSEYDSCTCEWGDTVLYFGRYGVPQSESALATFTDYTATFVINQGTNTHYMGNGNGWKILQNPYYTDTNDQNCNAYGVPTGLMACDFTDD